MNEITNINDKKNTKKIVDATGIKDDKPKAKRRTCNGLVKSKVAKGLIAMSEASKEVTNVYSVMNDVQRKLFVSLASGDDELIATLKAKYYHGVRRIVKIVYLKDTVNEDGSITPGAAMHTSKLTINNVRDLNEASYERLLRIAKSDVKHIIGKTDYSNLIVDVKKIFKLLAPEQIAVLASIAQKDSAKDADRIRAANSILDRADYRASGTDNKNNGASSAMPVNVNIIIGGKPKAEYNPLVDAKIVDESGNVQE